jgi:hypothetical protein
VVVTGGDATTVSIADSSTWNRHTLSRTQFIQWWGGFYAISTPLLYQSKMPIIPLKNIPSLPTGLQAQAYEQEAWNDAQNAGINPTYFVRQINKESGFNPSAVSPAGAQGIAQFMPATAAHLGVDPYDPESALPGAAHLVATEYQHYFDPSVPNASYVAYEKAFAAYNAGEGAVNDAVAACGDGWITCLPCETRDYIHVILNDANIPRCSS